MPKLSIPPDISSPRFMDWLNDLVRFIKAMPTDTGTAVAPTGIITVPYGGTGAQTLSGYIKGNGTNMFTAVSQIPYSDISGLPTARNYGPNVDALDQTGATGIYALTAYGASAVRTMTGTAGRLSITNGSGVAGNPTFNIDTAYVGQATITTLGTVTAGTWTAAIVAPAYLGTGTPSVANFLRGDGIWSAVGGGSFATTAITATVLASALWAEIVVVDATVSAASKITLFPGMTAETDMNDWIEGDVTFKATAGTGQFTVTLQSKDNSFLFGPYKLQYTVG